MNKPRDGVPEDYPGRIVTFPSGVQHLVFGMYGVQSRDATIRERFIGELAAWCALADGPGRVERCHFVDSEGYDCDMLVTYATDADAHARWWAQPDIQLWWHGLFRDADAKRVTGAK